MMDKTGKDAQSRQNTIKSLLKEYVPYLTRERGYGQGNVRIGDTLDMDDSIYSLGFVSQICDKEMDPYFDVIKGTLLGVKHDGEESSESEEGEEAEEEGEDR